MENVYNKNGELIQLTDFNDFIVSLTATNISQGYALFPNGLLICFGRAQAEAGEVEATYTYPKAFKYIPITVAVHNWSTMSRGQVTIGSRSKTQVKIEIYDLDNDTSKVRHADIISIGITDI